MWFRAFAPGEQYLGHKQLIPGKSQYGIICITYAWLDGDVEILKWDPKTGQKGIIEAFDKIAATADLVVGKNSDKFDVKMINGIRALHGVKGNPRWAASSDDLEKQMRRYFRLPSQSLDYISSQLGFGGKIKMEMSHWVKIDEYMTLLTLRKDGVKDKALNVVSQHLFRKDLETALTEGLEAFEFMCYYGKKDTDDTRALWKHLSEHFDSKFNNARFQNDGPRCKHADCGSKDLKKNGYSMAGGTKYCNYLCNTCYRYAGKCAVSAATDKEGNIK